MADLPRKASQLAARQHGVLTIRQLIDAGVSRHTMRRLERHGVLDADFKSVRRLTSAVRTLEQRCTEVCLAHPQTYITGVTAGTLIGLRKMPKHSPIVLGSPHALHVEHVGVKVRRTTRIERRDVLRRADGIRIASPTRLAFDLAANLGDHAHRSVVDQLIHEHDVAVPSLVETGRRLCHPTRPGSGRFLATLSSVTDSPTESDAELRVAEALRALGIPLETNTQWLALPNCRQARLDLAVPALKWSIEIDVHPSHLGVIGATNDNRGDRQASMLGWSISRVTGLDFADFPAMIRELREVYEARRRAHAA